MATEQSIMAVMRAPGPRFRTAFDTAAYAVHAAFVSAGYVLRATGLPALADDALSISSKDEVGMENWKDADDIYAFVYSNPANCSKKVLAKCVVMNDTLLVDALKEGGSPLHLQLDVDEYVEKNGGDIYLKNLEKLVHILNKEILNKLDAATMITAPPSSSTTKNTTSSKYVRPPSFFMICKGDFSTKLTLPAVFVVEHGLHLFPLLSLQLKTEPSGASWTVKIKKMSNGIYYFTDGWSKFVRSNNIIESKVLVFDLVGESTLHVSIFGVDSCLELPTPPSPSSSSDDYEGEDSGEGEGEKGLRFVKKLKGYNFDNQRMEIPMKFALGSGIARKEKVLLENGRGRVWPVTVKDRNQGIYSFTSGWVKFLADNQLKRETILVFTYVGENVVNVAVMESEQGEHLLLIAGRGGYL